MSISLDRWLPTGGPRSPPGRTNRACPGARVWTCTPIWTENRDQECTRATPTCTSWTRTPAGWRVRPWYPVSAAARGTWPRRAPTWAVLPKTASVKGTNGRATGKSKVRLLRGNNSTSSIMREGVNTRKPRCRLCNLAWRQFTSVHNKTSNRVRHWTGCQLALA